MAALSDPEAEKEALAALSIDDSLPVLERLERYGRSDIALQRLFQVKNLAECLRACSVEEVCTRVVPVVVELGADREADIREAVATQIPNLVEVLVQDKNGYQLALDEIVPVLTRLVVDPKNPEVRVAAETSLVKVSTKFSNEHVGSHILTSVLLLAHDDDVNEEKDLNRSIATQLLGMLAPALGKELCQSYVVAEIISLSDDDDFRVRKAAAANLSRICQAVGYQLTTQRLLPLYERLANDDIWGVRKSCAESLVKMSERLPQEMRCERLVPCLNKFLSDSSRWVRNATFGVLGPFIATLPGDDVSGELLTHFTDMADPESLNGDSDMTYSCAYNFPAVVQTVGKERWEALAGAYTTLAADSRWKVRRSLAMSVHVVAQLVETDITEKTILPIFDSFLKDIDEVRFPAVHNLSEVLAVVSVQARLRYLDTLSALRVEADNWRFRKALAKQLVSATELYETETVADVLLPLALSICKDPFARVRVAACSSLGPMLKRVIDDLDEDRAQAIVDNLTAFGSDTHYHIRLTLAIACGRISEALDAAVFAKFFLPSLLQLARDPIPNVRLAAARELVLLGEKGPFSEHSEVQDAVARLVHDSDSDVRFHAARCGPDTELPPYDGRKARENDAPEPLSPPSPLPPHVDPSRIAAMPEDGDMPGTPRHNPLDGR